jgi:hypothetical protein
LLKLGRSWKWISWSMISLKIIIMAGIRDRRFWPVIRIILKFKCHFFLPRLGSLSDFLIIHLIVSVKVLYIHFIFMFSLKYLIFFRLIYFFFRFLMIQITFLILTICMDSERLVSNIDFLLVIISFGRMVQRWFRIARGRLLQNIHDRSMDIPTNFSWKSLLLLLLFSAVITYLLLLIFYYFISFSFKIFHSFIQGIPIPECKRKLLWCFQILAYVLSHMLYFLFWFLIFYYLIDFVNVLLF